MMIRKLKRFIRDDRGVMMLEYAFVVVPMLYAIVSIVEVAGMLVTQQVLEQVTAQAAHHVSGGALIDQSTQAAKTTMTNYICNKNLGLISKSSCTANINVDVRNISASSVVPSSIKDGAVNAAAFGIQAISTQDTALILVRAAVKMPTMSPFWNPVLNNMGSSRLLVATALTRLDRQARYNTQGVQ